MSTESVQTYRQACAVQHGAHAIARARASTLGALRALLTYDSAHARNPALSSRGPVARHGICSPWARGAAMRGRAQHAHAASPDHLRACEARTHNYCTRKRCIGDYRRRCQRHTPPRRLENSNQRLEEGLPSCRVLHAFDIDHEQQLLSVGHLRLEGAAPSHARILTRCNGRRDQASFEEKSILPCEGHAATNPALWGGKGVNSRRVCKCVTPI